MKKNKVHTKASLIKDIKEAGIIKNKTLLIHSSMKSIGEVEGGADTVLDAFITYMKEGLLLFPTHSLSARWMLWRVIRRRCPNIIFRSITN